MTIGKYAQTFYNYPINTYDANQPFKTDAPYAYRIACEYDSKESATEQLEKLFAQVPFEKIEALVIGPWQEAYEESPQDIINMLIANKDRLSNLKAIFSGDMTYEDCEISWITQGNYKPLLDAYPQLEEFKVRGAMDLNIGVFEHPNLKSFSIESGGLDISFVQDIAASHTPKLEHLELWLGDDGYGFSGDVQSYKTLLSKIISQCPALRYLGLKNAMIADELAVMLAKEEWISKLETLDLSMGTIGDIGGTALLESPYIKNLRRLNLEHNYFSEAMLEKLCQLPIEVNIDDAQGDEDADDRYVCVSE